VSQPINMTKDAGPQDRAVPDRRLQSSLQGKNSLDRSRNTISECGTSLCGAEYGLECLFR
jgi:hypothetical protein